jgi:NAD(P)-dependent dehydrogenase (short-subunit alcohol dehydrogenase family)
MKKWTTADMPPMKGRTVVITGVGGLAYEDALALAKAGAKVIIAGRSQEKGQQAITAIREAVANADIAFELVDLADLQSVADLGKRLNASLKKIDVLINNAGLMTPPKRLTTKDGFEIQFGTNYLAHFALTAHLLPLLRAAKGRVVTLSSVAARQGAINFDDLQAEKTYSPMPVYAQSKLACLMFALELQRRSDQSGWGITSIAAHPGISRTNLLVAKDEKKSLTSEMRKYAWFLFQPSSQGALPTLFAATSPEARPGAYYGPDRLNETRGYPKLAIVPKQAADATAAARLWTVSETLSKITF